MVNKNINLINIIQKTNLYDVAEYSKFYKNMFTFKDNEGYFHLMKLKPNCKLLDITRALGMQKARYISSFSKNTFSVSFDGKTSHVIHKTKNGKWINLTQSLGINNASCVEVISDDMFDYNQSGDVISSGHYDHVRLIEKNKHSLWEDVNESTGNTNDVCKVTYYKNENRYEAYDRDWGEYFRKIESGVYVTDDFDKIYSNEEAILEYNEAEIRYDEKEDFEYIPPDAKENTCKYSYNEVEITDDIRSKIKILQQKEKYRKAQLIKQDEYRKASLLKKIMIKKKEYFERLSKLKLFKKSQGR